MDRDDLRKVSPKIWYPMLSKSERHMLKIYLSKYNVFMDQQLKECEHEVFRVAKIELTKLDTDFEHGLISENYYNEQGDEILMLLEAEFFNE